jgi:hypothetical protein
MEGRIRIEEHYFTGTESDGLCHFMQVHPDGEADYVGLSPELMDHNSGM